MLTSSLLLCLSLSPAPASACNAPRAVAACVAEDVQKLLSEGRALLEQGKAREALALFERAAAADKDSLATRVWVLRGWMETGRVNDSLDGIDELAKQHKGPEIDYLYGMAFLRSAEKKIAEGKADATTSMNFADSTAALQRATQAQPDAWPDAWPALCKAARGATDAQTARAAGEKAVALYPQRAECWFELGQAALDQFKTTPEEERAGEAAQAAWKRGIEALERNASLIGDPPNAMDTRRRAGAELELAGAFLWNRKSSEAAAAYARAMACEPAVLDFAQLQSSLGAAGFLAALESGAAQFNQRWGADDTRDGLLQWWLGSARFGAEKYKEAEPAFLAAAAKAPQYLSSWYYLARCRTAQQDAHGAASALREHWTRGKADLVAWLKYDLANNRAMLQWITGVCARSYDTQAQAGKFDAVLDPVEDGVLVSEIEIELDEKLGDNWSNLGLFLRDQGDALAGYARMRAKNAALPERGEPGASYERSAQAYAKAVELEPANPDFLNDYAVVLHYNLQRDLPKVRELYTSALAQLESALAKPDLDADLRKHYTDELKGWIENNLKRLDSAQKKAAPAGGASPGAPGAK